AKQAQHARSQQPCSCHAMEMLHRAVCQYPRHSQLIPACAMQLEHGREKSVESEFVCDFHAYAPCLFYASLRRVQIVPEFGWQPLLKLSEASGQLQNRTSIIRTSIYVVVAEAPQGCVGGNVGNVQPRPTEIRIFEKRHD